LVSDEEKAVAKHAAATKQEEAANAALAAAEAAVATGRDTTKALAEVTGRTQEIVKKLPKEKDLADAARVFANRSAAAATALVALEKASSEKAAALKKTSEERAAVAGTVQAARTRLREVRDSVRRVEAIALEARRNLAGIRSNLENHQRRIAAMEAYSRWHGLRRRIDANRRETEALQPALAEAERRSAALADVVSAREAGAKTAESARLAADKVRADAELALGHERKTAASLDAAVAATQGALALLPGDAALIEAAAKLKGKSDTLRLDLTGFESRLEAARSASQTKADAAQAASDSVKSAAAERSRREQDVRVAREKIAAAKARGEALGKELTEATDELTNLLGSRFAMAQLKPLTAEQMYWSMVKVTGVYDRTREAQEAELAKAKPLNGAAANEPASRRARAIDVEQKTHDKLKSDLRAFIRVYGAGAGQPQNEFFATADQALFVSNGGSINGWIAPSGGNVSQRMAAEGDTRKAAEDLYLTILSRPPTADETADVVRMLAVPSKEKPAVIQELVWGLLTSVEFRFNH
jgi:chromosome segregation ATPase